MEWQLPLAGALVALAAAFVSWKTWRTWHPPKGSCGGGCGCASKPATQNGESLIPPQQLTLRRRSS